MAEGLRRLRCSTFTFTLFDVYVALRCVATRSREGKAREAGWVGGWGGRREGGPVGGGVGLKKVGNLVGTELGSFFVRTWPVAVSSAC